VPLIATYCAEWVTSYGEIMICNLYNV